MLEGWNLHVLYSQGKSVMEVYKQKENYRIRIIHLLNLQAVTHFGKKDRRISCWRTLDFWVWLQRNDKVRAKN